MTESLGLSIGVANLVAARVGSTAVSRKSVLTIFDHRAGEVGLPEENPNLNEPGLVMRGFVERVGDGSPLVAADGTKYLGEALTVEALEAMARTVGYGTPIAIAIPAYWSERQSAALRDEFFAQPALAPNGVPPLLISDATAALTALRTRPGFPTNGVVALCDFGAGGTSITLSNAGSNFQQVGSSVRYGEFSGDEIDQLIANHLRATGSGADMTGTVRMGSQARLLGECQRAKEELSGASEATIASIPGSAGADIRLSRTEFEQLISGPLDRFVSTVEEILQRNGIRANLAAVATVGGGASIPVLTTRLSERLQVPIFTTPQPVVSAAVGAAVLGQQQSSAGAPTAAAPVIETPTQMAPARRPTDPGRSHCVGNASAAGMVGRRRRGRRAGSLHRWRTQRRICQGGSGIRRSGRPAIRGGGRTAAVVQTHGAGPQRGRRPYSHSGCRGVGADPWPHQHQPGQHHPAQRAPANAANRDDHRARQQHLHDGDPAAAPHHQQPAAGDDDLRAHHHGRAPTDHDGPAAHDHPAAHKRRR